MSHKGLRLVSEHTHKPGVERVRALLMLSDEELTEEENASFCRVVIIEKVCWMKLLPRQVRIHKPRFVGVAACGGAAVKHARHL